MTDESREWSSLARGEFLPLHPPAGSLTNTTAPCIFIYRQRQWGLAWKQDTSAARAPRRRPLRHALRGRASSPAGSGSCWPKIWSQFRSLVLLLGVHGFDRGELEQPAENGPARGACAEAVKAESWAGILPRSPSCTPWPRQRSPVRRALLRGSGPSRADPAHPPVH